MEIRSLFELSILGVPEGVLDGMALARGDIRDTVLQPIMVHRPAGIVRRY